MRQCALFVIAQHGMEYIVGTGVATAQKFAQRPTAFLPQHYRHFGQQGYSNKTENPSKDALGKTDKRLD